jgi:predicted metal-dependent HD superfamily phosphohydrolase
MADIRLASVEELLRSSFRQLAHQLGGNEATAQKWTNALITQHSESPRRYHTIEHVHSMLTCLEQTQSQIKHEMIVKLAIFFHDWIYDPKAKDNELQSIECFKSFSEEIKLSPSITTTVAAYIECTIQHRMSHEHESSDLALFLDFDLEVLSRPGAEYVLYAQQIRQEYSHVNEKDYCAGRIKVLKSFLDRERLYFSDAFYKEREETARENIRTEIGGLQFFLEGLSASS